MSGALNRPVDLLVTIVAKPGRGDAVADIVLSTIEQTRAEEGNVRFDAFRDRHTPEVFKFIERWASKDAVRAHTVAPHYIDSMQRMEVETTGSPDVVVLSEVDR